MTLSRGSNISVTVDYGDGTIEQNKLPDSIYYELGEDPNGATETTGDGIIAFVGYPVKENGTLFNIEMTFARLGSFRVMILRKPALQSSIIDQSNQVPRRTRCSDAEMFDLDNQSCCTSGIGCQSSQVTQNLTGYTYQHIIYDYQSFQYVSIPTFKSIDVSVNVIKGDIIVLQPYGSSGGQLAKLNKNSSAITALTFSTDNNIEVGNTFESRVEPVATRDIFAFRAIYSSGISHEIKHLYNRDSSFSMNFALQSSGRTLTVFSKPIIVQEKLHSVNISIPRRGLVNGTSLFNIEAFGTDLTMTVSFGDGFTQMFSNVQPIEHQYPKKDVFNVDIQIYNKVSWYWMQCQYETIMPVILDIHRCREGFVYQPLVPVKTILYGGDFANISTKFSDGGEEHFVSNISMINFPVENEINHSFPNPDAYDVTAFAINGLSNTTVKCTIYVEIPIQGLDMSNISSSINVAHNISLPLTAQGGSNLTYKGILNDKPAEITCVNSNCSQAGVLILAGSYPTGKNTLTACVYNHVTLGLCRTAYFTAYQIVSGTLLLLRHAYLVDQTVDVSVAFQNGSDVSCFLELQGYQAMQQKCKAGFVMTKSVTCATSGVFKVLANCSNMFSFEYRESNFSCIYPVRQTVLTSNSPQSILTGTINFTLSHIAPVPSSAACHVDFGDSVKMVFEDCFLPLNFSHKYSAEGDYLVNASVYNKLTSKWSSTFVKIEEPIEVIILEIERSPCDQMYGKPGGGPLNNMFPVECPMIFKIAHMDGTRPNVEWNFGDNQIQLMNSSVRTQTHTCAQEGLYNFTVKAFNQISSLSSHLVYECRPSIKCTIYEDSPFLTYEPANITLHIENADYLTAVLIDFGDGEFQVVGASARKNDFPGFPFKVIEPIIVYKNQRRITA
ncbi:uncharacterized protein LOC116303249 [Actinia tenebrosa]|uniref:Uncharacterized protein LOC116303249 n=1 Tax=Actinia tenebrosa TaxID=6105 RepID=A0A6P8IQC0_ACTTE|nr:uncharacterized protein LOC116303249 [Actinia tenebrosa]